MRRGEGHTHLVPEILISEDHKLQKQPGIPVGANKTLLLNYMPRALQFKILATVFYAIKNKLTKFLLTPLLSLEILFFFYPYLVFVLNKGDNFFFQMR